MRCKRAQFQRIRDNRTKKNSLSAEDGVANRETGAEKAVNGNDKRKELQF